MVHLNEEGKFNENSYLIDAEFFKLKKTLALYVIENKGARMLIDTGEALAARKIIKKLEALNLLPIQKILLTHIHWDHIQALPKLLKLLGDTKIEVLAHRNGIEVLKHPEKMNEFFGYPVEAFEGATPLKENDVIDLNGLKLRIVELFGHTQDSIGIQDEKNKNLLAGDAILDKIDNDTYMPVLFGPKFSEKDLIATYKKLRGLKPRLKSISLAHFGTYTDQDFNKFVDEVENLYFKAKDLIVKAYNEKPDEEYVSEKYLENIIPNSKLFTKESLMGVHWNIKQNIKTLKAAGFIK